MQTSFDQGTLMALKSGGLFGDDYRTKAKNIISERFLIPPFSILNTREGFWQQRKKQWISIGIKSELGRGYTQEGTAFGTAEEGRFGKPGDKSALYTKKGLTGNLRVEEVARQRWSRKANVLPGGSALPIDRAKDVRKYKDASPGGSPRPAMRQPKDGKPTARGDGAGRILRQPSSSPYSGSFSKIDMNRNRAVETGLTFNVSDADHYLHQNSGTAPDEPLGGTSIFDPVLCELIYRWFCPPKSKILDPFAGGSVRGIVAGELGHQYTGIDLSGRQIEANYEQARVIGTAPAPVWLNGDSRDVLSEMEESGGCDPFNLLFSCPPYGDLERYSDDPRDLSAMSVEDFQESYFDVIAKACDLLAPNSFACFVVGDYRDKDGYYCNLPAVTIAAFEEAGLRMYNYMILVNAIGSLPLRINNQFNGSRKIGKTHQDVLVFAKGNPRDFVKSWPPMEGFNK